MKGAAAALAGALLFFLGVLTVASDGARVPAPPAIPLGVDRTPATPAAETPGTPVPEAPPADGEPPGDPTLPAEGAPGSGGDDPSSTPPAGEEPPGGGGAGGVEEVDGQVDCVEVDGRADSGQDADPPGDGDPGTDACPPGQAKKTGDRPKDQKGAGDDQP